MPPSPSSCEHVSTRCSSVLGPASAPSLVTWPTMTSARPSSSRTASAGPRTRGPARATPGSSRAAACRGLDRVDREHRRARGVARARGSSRRRSRRQTAIAGRGAEAARAHRGLRDRLLAGRRRAPAPGAATRARRGPAAAASTCRCPGRRRAARASPARGRRRARDRARRGRSDARGAASTATSAVGRGARASETPGRSGAPAPPLELLDQRVPLAARRAAPEPARLDVAAALAPVDGCAAALALSFICHERVRTRPIGQAVPSFDYVVARARGGRGRGGRPTAVAACGEAFVALAGGSASGRRRSWSPAPAAARITPRRTAST